MGPAAQTSPSSPSLHTCPSAATIASSAPFTACPTEPRRRAVGWGAE